MLYPFLLMLYCLPYALDVERGREERESYKGCSNQSRSGPLLCCTHTCPVSASSSQEYLRRFQGLILTCSGLGMTSGQHAAMDGSREAHSRSSGSSILSERYAYMERPAALHVSHTLKATT